MRVSVITPTWQRPEALFRCMVSVQLQTHSAMEHLVVSDGPDDWLRREMDQVRGWTDPTRVRSPRVIYGEMATHEEPHDFGSRCRNRGVDVAKGDIVAFLDDDNTWRPRHLEVLLTAMAATGADFAYSQGLFHMARYNYVVGMEPPQHAQIDSSLIVCRRDLVVKHPWPSPASRAADWEVVHSWIRAGAKHVFVPEVTMDYYAGAEAAKV